MSGKTLVSRFAVLVFLAVNLPGRLALAGPTLDRIRATQTLNCGVNTEEAEYTIQDAHGNRALFDADICRAVAVAVLGPQAKYKVVPFRDEEESFKGLRTGRIDLLATGSSDLRNSGAPPQKTDGGTGGFGFTRPVLYDYQAFLVNKTMGIASPKDLAGKKTCFIVGSPMGDQVEAYMNREGIKWIPGPFSEEGEMEAAFVTRNCAAVTADVTQLAYERLGFRGMAKNFEILPDVVAKDPLATAYRLDDPQWAVVIDWTIEGLIQAEESGVTRSNLPEMRKSSDLIVQRLLGTQKGWGLFLGLDDTWAAQAIEAVGNYGELFERDLGAGSPLKIPRGPNSLWTNGGLMYALPMR
jgi:general L-amino acid transport system substrate-binding protein